MNETDQELQGQWVGQEKSRYDFTLKLLEQKSTTRGYFVYRMTDRYGNFFIAFDGREQWNLPGTKEGTHENDYEDQDKYPQKMSLFIPSESVSAFCEEVMKMVDTKQKKGKVWDYSKKEEVEVDGIYINAKAKEGKYGLFGNINLNFIEPTAGDDIPF